MEVGRVLTSIAVYITIILGDGKVEKTEAMNKLKKAGYEVQFDSSIVTVILPSKVNVNQEIKKLKSFFQEIGYDSSFGIKQNKGKLEKTEESLQDTEASLEEMVTETAELSEVNQEELFEVKDVESEIVEIGEQFSLEDFGIS